ncbi:MAG TPA: molybdopterin-binding protein [Burkholderiaceae bacterium]|nr:molybdopterin-binding protein [Burkholderiaceae bacterium]
MNHPPNPLLQPHSPPPLRPEAPGAFGLIVIGDEILSGKRADKHLAKVIELLGARGLALDWAEYVGDSPARITAALKRAFESGDVVFSTGGIGATPDDHTRQCAARALGVDLALHPEAAALILERMQDIAREQGKPYEPERPDNAHRLNMGVFPAGARIIPNPYNKIPGFSCYPPRPDLSAAGPSQGAQAPAGGREPHAVGERGGDLSAAGPSQGAKAPAGGSEPHDVGERGGIHFVPGFPVMAWPMIEWVLDTHYRHRFASGAWTERSVIVFGAMEATLTPLMEAIERAHPRLKVFSLPSVDHPEHGRHIELGIKGDPLAVAQAWPELLGGLSAFPIQLGPELVRNQ